MWFKRRKNRSGAAPMDPYIEARLARLERFEQAINTFIMKGGSIDPKQVTDRAKDFGISFEGNEALLVLEAGFAALAEPISNRATSEVAHEAAAVIFSQMVELGNVYARLIPSYRGDPGALAQPLVENWEIEGGPK